MSWLRIVHDTTYRYNKAVRFGPHQLLLRPREGHDVHIEAMCVKIEPEFELEWSRDLFGNCVATAHILSPGERFADLETANRLFCSGQSTPGIRLN